MTKWPADNEGVKCQIGFYYRKMVDWLTIGMSYDQDNKKIVTNCQDGHSDRDDINDIKNDIRTNCFLDDKKSKAEVSGKKAYF